MHMKGTPETMQINPSYDDLMGEITDTLIRDIRVGCSHLPDNDADVAAAIAEDFSVNLVTNTLHPVNFSIPSAVMAGEDGHVGMVHPVNPWAKAVAEDDLDG